jgi:glycosyltransferase involved in cell wall biosynthesis
VEPDITIVTPSLDQAAFLERCLASVRDQGLGDRLEHLVYDGGSTDGSLAILARWAEGGGSARRFVSEPDRGMPHAVNRGFAAARGRVLGWLNSDDVYEPGAVAHALRVFRDRPDVEILYGDGSHIDADDRFLEPYPTADWDYELLQQTCFVCQPAVFLRRSVFERHGGLDESLAFASADYEYWLRLGASLAFHRERTRLASTRLHPGARTVAQRLPVFRATCQMLRARLGYTPLRWLYLTAREELLAEARADAPVRRDPAYLARIAAGMRRLARGQPRGWPAGDVASFARWWVGERLRSLTAR